MNIYRPCAKINLGLNIVARRADGYHELETVFYPIPLCDELRVEAAERFAFRQEGIALDCAPEDNLVVRAVRAYTQMAGLAEMPPLALTLRKNIPSGAGLGGGSSDAAMAVLAVRDWLRGGGKGEGERKRGGEGKRGGETAAHSGGRDATQTVEELERMLAGIGADCPFFVRSRPVMARGIGDIMTPIGLSLSGWTLVLVRPDVHVSTKEAYGMIRPQRPELCVEEIVREPVERWQGLLVNDFEAPVIAAHPVIGEVKRELLDMGATYAAMSGSGSAVFGLFRDEVVVDRFQGMFCYVGKLT